MMSFVLISVGSFEVQTVLFSFPKDYARFNSSIGFCSSSERTVELLSTEDQTKVLLERL